MSSTPMNDVPLFRQPLAAIVRGVERWYAAEGSGRASALLLVAFVPIWTAYHIIANSSIDLHFDLLEAYAWGRNPSGGYFKHPPLSGLVSGAWFAIFPAADWAYHLLAMCNAALALFAADRIARRYLTGDKRLLALILLLLFPFYQFHAQRYSTNQLLLSTWPIATWCFLRAFESRTAGWAIAAGATAALAMLSKYYSIYLIAAFILAALVHRDRWFYLRSASPWLSALTGLAVLSPHLIWLKSAAITPFDYAYAVHGAASLGTLIGKAAGYLAGAAGYAALPVAVYAFTVRPDRATLAAALWPADPDRRMLVVLLAAMILLPPLTAPLIGMQLTSLWTLSAWFLLPVVLLAPDSARPPRPRAVQAALLVGLVTVGALLASPLVAWIRFLDGARDDRAYQRLVMEQLAQRWREAAAQPLRIVLSGMGLGAAAAFYHPDHPDAAPDFNLRAAPWITEERIRREGWAAVCRQDDAPCLSAAEARRAADSRARSPVTIEVTPRFLGRDGKTQRYVLILAPPANAAAAPGGAP